MKITKKYLQKIIKEEIKKLLQEDPDGSGAGNLNNISDVQLNRIYEKCMESSGEDHERQCGHFAKELQRRMLAKGTNK